MSEINRNKRAPISGNHLPASRVPPDWRSVRVDDRGIMLAVWRDSPFTDALEEGYTDGAGFPQGVTCRSRCYSVTPIDIPKFMLP